MAMKNKVLGHPVLFMIAVLLSACQPTSNNKNTESSTSAISKERLATIEDIAGVPMATLIEFDPQEIKQGGDTGISISSSESYSKPSSNIPASRKGNFLLAMLFLSSRGW